MTLEKAIDRAFDTCNLSSDGDSLDIYAVMYRYKAIRELPDDEFEKVYEEISARLGFMR